jgi:uncharacterized repeat protein (TIGR03803 family)/autotransporter-associated beta strand protein
MVVRRERWSARLGFVLLLVLAGSAAHGQSLTTLVSFTGSNGASPAGDLTLSGTTLYGMTSDLGPGGAGTIFSLPISGGPASTLVSFSGSNGANPSGSLTLSAGTFYGMTQNGGANEFGTVFSYPLTGGPLKVLYSFDYDVYGAYPNDSVIISGSTLYGLASQGGPNDSGTIFSLSTTGGTPKGLYAFQDTSDGGYPYGSLTQSGSLLYGMTSDGGANGGGTVFRIPTGGGLVTTMLSFASSSANPTGSLLLNGSTLYGLTSGGGTSNLGAVFSMPAAGGAATTLFSFNGTNGSNPGGSLLLSGSTLFGTTANGGSSGLGTVFKINTDGTGFQTLFSFNGANGDNPDGTLIISGSKLYGTTEFGGSSGSGTVFALNIAPATIVLSNAASATIITGGTAQLGMTLANAATSGYNLNYTLGAAATSGSAALGAPSPGSGSLAPGATRSCTVSATSTHIGANTISFTVTGDTNASNSPQSIAATLNVLDHSAGSASVFSGNGFVAHAGATGLTAGIALANSSGTRSDLEVRSGTLSSGLLLGGSGSTYWLAPGTGGTYTAAFSAGTTAGAFSNTASFTAGDRQTLPGASAIGTLTATITGSIFSGSAAWNSTSGSLWGGGGNWTDTSAASVHAAPGTFAGFANTDAAIFSGSGTVTTVSLSGANLSLADLSFSGSNYTLTDGTLNLNSGSGTATLNVASGTQTIRSALAGTSLLLVQGAGSLVLSGSNTFSGGVVVAGGRLIIANSYSLPSGANLTVGNAGAFNGSPVNGHWITEGGGSWSSAANWDSNGVPGANIQDTATFGTIIGSKSATVTLDGSRALSSLTFTTTGGGHYTLSRAGSDSSSSLILSGLAGTAALVDSGGSQTIAAPVTLGGNLNATISNGAAVAISGPISESGGSRSLSLNGGGTLILSGTNSFSGGTFVTGGKLIVTAPYSLLDGTDLTVGNSGAFNESLAVDGHWITAGGGSWSSAANWDSNGVPGATMQDTATFGAVIGSKSANVTLDGSRTLGSLTFTTTAGGHYTLSRAGSDSTSALVMSGLAGTAALVDSGGSQTIAAPVVLGSNLNVNISTSAALTIGGPISESGGSRSLSLGGGGTLVLSGTNSFSGGTFVTGGKLIVTGPYSLLDGTNLTVGNSGVFPAPIIANDATRTDSSATAVPEPDAFLLLAAAISALLCWRARCDH